jgi:hypothetical protein
LVCLVAIVFDRVNHDSWFATLREWQTLLGTVIALATGLLAVSAIGRQIAQAQDEARENRDRRLAATRARLPFALAELVGYTEQSVAFLKNATLFLSSENQRSISLELENSVKMPLAALDVLCSCIESAPPDYIVYMAKLIEDLQIHNSRLLSLARSIGNPPRVISEHSHSSRILETVELYYRCQSLFDFARRTNDPPPNKPSIDEIELRAELLGFQECNFPDVYNLTELRRQAGEHSSFR